MNGIKKWIPLMVLSTAIGIVTMDMTITNVSLNAIIADLHTNLRSFQWMVTGYSLILAAFTITGGRLGDLFGRKRLFIIGAILFSLGSLIAAISQHAWTMLLGIAAVEGVGAALMLPASSALVLTTYTDRKDRAIAFGVYAGMAGVMASIGPLLGGYLTTHYTWRWAYLINPFIVLLLLWGVRLVRESRETDHKPTLDLPSVALSVLFLASIVFGIIESSAYGWFTAKQDFMLWGHALTVGGISVVAWALMLGTVLLGIFLARQRSLEKQGVMPLVSTKLLTNRQFMSGTTTGLILTAMQFGVIFVTFVFLQVARGYTAFSAGLGGISLPLSILVFAPLGGVLMGVAKMPAKWLIQAGIVMSMAGIWWFYQVAGVATTGGQLLPALAVFGAGFGLTLAPIATLTLSAVSLQEGGEATGVNNTFREVGSSFGQALLGAVLIAGFIGSFAASMHSNKVLPASITAAAVQTVSKSEIQDPAVGKSVAKLSRAFQKEIVNTQHLAAANGVRKSLIGGLILGATALIVSAFLPRKAR
jgi:MFS family permease